MATLLVLPLTALATDPALPDWTLSDLSLGAGLLLLFGLLLGRRRAHRAMQQALEDGRLAQQSLRELLDKAPAAIWRTDTRGRLVFANRRLCEALGRTEDELKALPRFRDAFEPAAAARMAGREAQALAREEPVFGQETREDAQGRRRHFDVVKVRVLDAAGRAEGVVTIATEVTEQREAEARLQQRYALERELLQISRGLMSADHAEVDTAIRRALALVGQSAGADRSHLFLLHEAGRRADNTHEWCAAGVEPQIARLQDCDIDAAWPWATAQLRRGHRVEIADGEALPPEAAADRASMAAQDIRAIVLLPMLAGGELAAFVGLDCARERPRWSEAEIGLLQVVGELLSQALLRTRAERQRQSALDELHALFNAIPDLIFVLDRHGRFLDFKGGELGLLMMAPGEFLGRRLEEVLPPELATQTRQALAEVLGGGSARFDYRVPVGAQLCDFELRLVGLADGRALSISRDITARKRFERALADSEQRFRELLEALPSIAVQGYDRELKVTFWNAGSERLYGYPREQALGQRLTELIIPPPFRGLVEQRTAEWFAGGEVAPPEELRLLRADGEEVVVLSSHAMQIKADGSRELFCLDIDLGPLRRAEEQLRLAASVFTHTQEGVLITDPQGRIVEVNQAFTEITGYPREAVIGQTPALLKSGRHDQDLYAQMWRSLVEQGHWVGEIWNRRRNGEAYAEYLKINAVRDDAGRVLNYVGLFADITAQKTYQQHLERIAHFDSLTGLPNRVLLADRLRQAMAHARRQQMQVAVAYIDLDGFKAINDHHGHDIGDRFLCAVGERMRQQLREWDTVARIGGDEFVVLLVNLPEGGPLQELLERLQRALSEPLQLESLQLPVAASIGVSLYPQDEELEAEQLLRQADQAMYQAKHGGKGHVRYFDAALDASNRSRQQLLQRLREALDAGELVLFYQPRFELRSGHVLGMEALMRWQHPQRGLLPPDAFLPFSEGEELGLALGEWALRQALSDLSGWQQQGLDLGVSVNIAPRHLLSPGFVERLQALLAAFPQLEYGSLTLEVLESSLLDDIDRATSVIARCREFGVGCALDDFGTGYSSLAYLKHLPFSELKIDRSFVRDMLADPEDLAIIQGIVGLARAFRLRLVAEGVETGEHARALLHVGCTQAQGYGIARPMPAAEVVPWLRGWRPDPEWVHVRELPAGGHMAMFVQAAHRGWLQQLGDWLDGVDSGGPPPARPARGFGRWLADLPPDLREGAAARQVWLDYQALHQHFDAAVAAHAAGGIAAARGRRESLLASGQRFIEGLEHLVVALAEGGSGRA
ncbi:bifunctional diguanylate cyclase/phosphodiesterase [Aquimonas voraii]|uniref:PAS domain S-box-containing protein/diguanylate cyclase (GGDEF) domain-containing protein n=1 Tax=Aquimonas voraii TaxID=265719 RepID=A0A1G6WRN5_9GAMM|nr:EAL domain-containing protein [Aquimonas voraii]SDD68610.1 PAS domain S-box-containing protein/diguanylate cyclase (GGDEF) domain-containing protein [Aquimonas voraii]